MRCLSCASVLLLLGLAGCGNSQPDPVTSYRETVRCYNAAANYAQQYVVAGATDEGNAMLGYAAELRTQSYALGAKLGKSAATVQADFRNDDSAYLHQFYAFANGTMTLTAFGNGEIAHCNLDKVLKP